MRVRFLTTGIEGDVLDTTYLPSKDLGDLGGTWHQVRWEDTLETTWVHADSIESIHPIPELPERPPWEEICRATTLSGKITVTAKSGPRVATKEFLNEHQLQAHDWEADFQFALRKATSNPRKGFPEREGQS